MGNNVPEIRFKGFDGEWKEKKLKSFGHATGGTAIESEFSENGKYKVISIGSYSENSTYTEQNIRANKTEKTKPRVLDKNDLTMILNDKTSIGKIIGRVLLIESDDTYVYNQRTERIEVDKKQYNPQFLYQLLNTDKIRMKIIRACQGNTQIYVNWSAISEFDYLVPERNEQTLIGYFFKQLDERIALQRQELEAIKSTKQGFLQKMFPAEGETLPQLRFPGFSGEWEEKKLGDAADIIGGGTPSTSKSEYWDGDIDWYSPAEIGDQVFVYESKKKITKLGLNKSSARILPVGTVLFTSRAGIGSTAILAREAATNQGFQSIVPHSNELDSYFAFSLTHVLKKFGETNGAGSTFVEISGKQMAKMPILLPTIEEQTLIGNFFKKLDDTIALHQQELDALEQTKKAFLQKMFV